MKNKKQIQPKKIHPNKKWIISLAIFGVVAVAAAAVLPLVMCKKPIPDNTAVYTTDVTNKALDATHETSDLTTRLNGNIIKSGVTYAIKTGGEYIEKNTSNPNEIEWKDDINRPVNTFTANIDAELDGKVITTAYIVLLPLNQTYEVSSDKQALQMVGDSTTIRTTLNGNPATGITYLLDDEGQSTLVSLDGTTGLIGLLKNPDSDTKVGIKAMHEGGEVGTTTITVLKKAPIYIINALTHHTTHTIFSDDGGLNIINDLDSIDLREFDEAPGTMFVITGNITCPIIIPANFSCSLIGAAGSKIDTSSATDTKSDYGVIIGNDTGSSSILADHADIRISDNNINSKGNGIYFANTITTDSNVVLKNNTIVDTLGIQFTQDTKAPVTIDNNSITSTSTTGSSGINFDSTVDSGVSIVNNTIKSSNTGASPTYGIYFHEAITTADVTIDNNSITSSVTGNATAVGIYFTTINLPITVTNNTVSVSSTGLNSYGIYINNTNIPTISIVNNIITVFAAGLARGIVLFNIIDTTSIKNITITGNSISASATGNSSSEATGIYFYSPIACALITITNNTISACISNDGDTTIYAYGIVFMGNITPANSLIIGNITIANNTISVSITVSPNTGSSALGVYFKGTCSTVIVFSYNTISASCASYYAYGLRFSAAINTDSHVTINNNTISTYSTGDSSIYGICFDSISTIVTITNNIISSSASAKAYITSIRFLTINAGSYISIINNTISSLTVDNTVKAYGIRFQNTIDLNSYTTVSFNDVSVSNVDGGGQNCLGIYFDPPAEVNHISPDPTNSFYWKGNGHLSVNKTADIAMSFFMNGDSGTGAGEEADFITVSSVSWQDDLDNPFIFYMLYTKNYEQRNDLRDRLQANKNSTTNIQAVDLLGGLYDAIPQIITK